MAESGAIRAGRAFVEITADDSKLQRSLANVERKMRSTAAVLNSVGRGMLTAGTALLAPLLAASKMYADMGDAIAKASKRTGISAEQLSTLGYAAKQSGADAESLENGIKKMSKAIVAAAEGSPEATKALRELGLTVSDLVGLSPDQQFKVMADALSNVTDPTLKSALAMKIFGRNGTELLPIMSAGAAGIEKLQAHARELGLEMSGKDAAAAEEFHDRLNDLWAVVKMGVFTVGGALAPVLRGVSLLLVSAAKATRTFVSEHQDLVSVAAGVGGALIAAGVAILGVGKAFGLAGSALKIMVGGLRAVGTLMAVLMSPTTLIVAAIGAGVYAFLRFTSAGQSVSKYLAGVFQTLLNDVSAAFGGIKDALAAGDWKLAAQILWAYLKLEFARGKSALTGIWIELKAALLEIWSGLTEGLMKGWSYLTEYLSSWAGVKAAASHFMAWFGSSWGAMVNGIADAWARQKVEFQAGEDIREKYAGRTMTGKDVRDIAAPQINLLAESIRQGKRQRIKREHPELSGTALDDEVLKQSGPAIEQMTKGEMAYFNKKFLGHSPTEDQLQALTDLETDARMKSLKDGQKQRDALRQKEYEAEQKSIDDRFGAAEPKAKRDAEVFRGKVGQEQSDERARIAAEAALAKAQANGGSEKEIDDLKRRLFELRNRAAGEAGLSGAPSFDKEGAGRAMNELGKSTVAGTFNGSAIFGLAGGGAVDAIREHTKRTAELLSKIASSPKDRYPQLFF